MLVAHVLIAVTMMLDGCKWRDWVRAKTLTNCEIGTVNIKCAMEERSKFNYTLSTF